MQGWQRFWVRDAEIQGRIDRYRALAAEAADAETNAIPRAWKEAYRTIAVHWSQLAQELDALAEPVTLAPKAVRPVLVADSGQGELQPTE